MSTAQPQRRSWLFLIKPRWLAWHAFAVVAFWGMLWLGDWQFHRAMGGNALSWAYTFEWPIFAVLGAIFWAKTIIDERRGPDYVPKKKRAEAAAGPLVIPTAPRDPSGAVPDGAHFAADQDDSADVDAELAAYNAYLARLNKEVRSHGKWHGLR